jgi:hypothetical protein
LKSREQLVHEAKCWRTVAGNWRGESFEHEKEARMLRHELHVRTRTFVIFWAAALTFCLACWAVIIYLVAWMCGGTQ